MDAEQIQAHDVHRLEIELVHLLRFDLLDEFAHLQDDESKLRKRILHGVPPALIIQQQIPLYAFVCVLSNPKPMNPLFF